jgi:hypothetical protein
MRIAIKLFRSTVLTVLVLPIAMGRNAAGKNSSTPPSIKAKPTIS